ncbi:MAG: alpha-L-fucosidase [Luteolibacter sp.]
MSLKHFKLILSLALVPASVRAQDDYTKHFDPGVMGPPAAVAISEAAVAKVRMPLAPGPFAATWDSVGKNYKTPSWFADAKFGIFLHWGLYAVPAKHNEWFEKHMYGAELKWQEEKYGPLEKFGYKDFIPKFTCEKFSGDEWATLFRKAGAKYVMPTAQHHDNFAMWDSKLTKIGAKDMGPKRDLIGELCVATRKQGLKFGVSNHGIENFTFINPSKAVSDRLKTAKVDLFDPDWKDIYHYADRSEAALTEFLTDWVERNIELIDKYQPDMLWFDNGVNGAKDRELDPLKLRVAAHYYNRAIEWKKEVSISTKGLAYAPSGDNFKQVGSIIDFEKIGTRSPPGIRPGPWQVDHPIGSTWGYTEGMTVSKADSIIPKLVDTVSKGGNFLLNLSPMADGTIPKAQQDTLLAIGRWLDVNGEAIYGTRPWRQFGEGNVRFTTKGDVLYAILTGKPGDLEIKALGGGKAGRVELLGSGGKIDFTQNDSALRIKLPARLSESPLVFRIGGALL